MKATWQTDNGRIQLYRGDTFRILPRLRAGCAGLVILDPPYGTTDLAWDKRVPLDELWPLVRYARRENAVTVGFGCQPFFTDLVVSNRREFRYELVFEKSNGTGFLDANRRPLRCHENIAVFSPRSRSTTYRPQFTEGSSYISRHRADHCLHYHAQRDVGRVEMPPRRYPRSVLRFTREDVGGGQTRKPTALIAWLIRTYTRRSELVLDPFLGSGSTVEAAIAEGRRVIGIEMDAERFRFARERIKAALRRRRAKACD